MSAMSLNQVAAMATELVNTSPVGRPYTISAEMVVEVTPLFVGINPLSEWFRSQPLAVFEAIARGERRIKRSERAAVKPTYMRVRAGQYEWLKGIVAVYVAWHRVKFEGTPAS